MKILKALFVVALILTLPVRGFAASMILPESPHHHGTMMMDHAEMAGMEGMDHHGHMDHHGTPSKGPVECHTCGDCCTGALPRSLFDRISAVIPAVTQIIPYLPQPYAGFIPGGLERPPRLS